jgi:phytoene dehydrogenase-like protein
MATLCIPIPLIEGAKIPRRYAKQERSTSALIFYWGMNRQFKELDIHNILFTEDYPEEFRHLFEYKTVYRDPTIYIFISSKRVVTDAPEGCENWFVMINVPENTGQDWEGIIHESRKRIIAKINRFLKTEIEQSLVFEERLDPLRIEEQTSSWHGSLYGPSSNSRLSAFLRHPNCSPGIKGLFFCGGSVHPGGGIPLCLSSAKIADGFIPPAGN